jgi:hypothetical protein
MIAREGKPLAIVPFDFHDQALYVAGELRKQPETVCSPGCPW